MAAGAIRVAEIMECTIGGTRRHIGELCLGLARRGLAVTLFASARRDETFREDLAAIAKGGVKVVTIPMRREIAPLADAMHAVRLARHLAIGRFDVVHTHSSKAGALGRFAARIAARGARIVHTPHTFAFNFAEQFGERKRELFLSIERRLGKVTDRMVHVSASERDEGLALGLVPADRAVVIENGIDPEPYAAGDATRLRTELGIDPTAPLIGAVGLLNEAKGHSFLVDAMELVRREVPGAGCVIAGEGALRGQLAARIASLGLEGSVRLLGFRKDIPDVLAALDVFAMPSLWEGMPYGVLEAMASSRPVVASDVNGCRDLVTDGDTGLLVPPRDAAALAAAIVRLIRDRALAARLGAAGRSRVTTRFSREAMIDRYVDLFRGLVGDGSRDGVSR